MSSDGGLGHKSYLWFHVKTSGPALYQFWYFTHEDKSARLSTMVDSSHEVYTIPLMAKDRWVKTQCFPLHNSFDGNLYIIAEHGGSANEDIAIDNVRLSSHCASKIIY